ncbi:MAG: spore coat protein [Sporolactobacillus sp.]|jgi:hypothetical protein|nr:spore coat protein [Sporolactobacillus sp.]MCI1880849.1 spore coat protein [Sporolactobacillus sp.]
MEGSPYSNKPVSSNPYAGGNAYPGMKPEAKAPTATSPAFQGKSAYGPWGQSPAGKGSWKGPAASNTLHCPPQQAGAVYDPQSVNVQDIYKPIVVQHIHPMHTQIRTHYVYEHQHYYPHSVSRTCDEKHYSVQCGRPCFPKPHC